MVILRYKEILIFDKLKKFIIYTRKKLILLQENQTRYISSVIERGEKLEEILSSQFSKQDSSSKLMIFHPNSGGG